MVAHVHFFSRGCSTHGHTDVLTCVPSLTFFLQIAGFRWLASSAIMHASSDVLTHVLAYSYITFYSQIADFGVARIIGAGNMDNACLQTERAHSCAFTFLSQIADFGVARIIGAGNMTAETGTYRWMAPEVIEHKPYGEKADIFSFAVVIWELLTCKVCACVWVWVSLRSQRGSQEAAPICLILVTCDTCTPHDTRHRLALTQVPYNPPRSFESPLNTHTHIHRCPTAT